LQAIATRLSADIRLNPSSKDSQAKLQARRAHNALMMSVDYLNVQAGLAAEDAIPVLRRALGIPDKLAAERPNPRRVRMAVVTDISLSRDRLRELLEMLQPWMETLQEASHDREIAEKRAQEMARDAAMARQEAEDRALEINSLRNQLEAARQETAQLNDELRDSKVIAEGDLVDVRGGSASALGRISTKLEMAAEAAELEPPRTNVLRRMLAEAREALSEHINWLRSSD
jgi:hypothetical protein